jgi:hypothetical protein
MKNEQSRNVGKMYYKTQNKGKQKNKAKQKKIQRKEKKSTKKNQTKQKQKKTKGKMFEDTKWIIRRTDNTMTKNKRIK